MGCGASAPAVKPNPDSPPPEKGVSVVPSPASTAVGSKPFVADAALEKPVADAKPVAAAAPASSPAAANDASSSSEDPTAKLKALDLDMLRQEFEKHDESKNGSLSKGELSALLESLLGSDIRTAVDSNGAPVLDSLLEALDTDGSGTVDVDELLSAWRAWFGAAMNPVRCLLIIDVQNDFIDGTLSIAACPAKQDPAAVVPVINGVRKDHEWDAVAVSLDWHPHEHCSFAESYVTEDESSRPAPLHESQDSAAAVAPSVFSAITLLSPDGESPMKQTMWPRHCVRDTWGAECHKDLVQEERDMVIYKGTDAKVDSYSAFYDNQKLNQTPLLSKLRERGVTHLFVAGLALDVCVAFSALHAAEEGFVVTVIEDGCAGVSDDGIAEKKAAFAQAGITVASSSELPAIFAKSSIDELTGAALRVRKAKEVAGKMFFEAGHGCP